MWDTQSSPGNPAVDVLPIPPLLPDTVAGKPSYKADAPPPFFAWEGLGSDLPTSTVTTTVAAAAAGSAVGGAGAGLMPPTPPTQIYGRPSFRAEQPPVYYAWSGAAGEEGKAADKQTLTPTQDKIYGRPSFRAEQPPVYYAWNGASVAQPDEKNIQHSPVDPSFVAGRPSVVVERPPYYYAWPEQQPPHPSNVHASPLFIKDARKVQHKDDNNTNGIPYFTAPPPAAIPQPLVAGSMGTSSAPIRKTVQRGQGSCPSTPISDHRLVVKKKTTTVDDSNMTMIVARPRTAVTGKVVVTKVVVPSNVVPKGLTNASKVPQKQQRTVTTPVSVGRPRTANGRMEGGASRDPTLVCLPYLFPLISTRLLN